VSDDFVLLKIYPLFKVNSAFREMYYLIIKTVKVVHIKSILLQQCLLHRYAIALKML
jgi:hypothetical protein